MTETAASPSTDKAVFHHFYDSPQDTIILRSSDNMLFRVSSYRLSKASPIFASMFTLDAAHSSEKPIDLEVSSIAVERFLTCINSSEPPFQSRMNDDVDSGFELLSISRMFECDSAKQRALQSLDSWLCPHPVFWRRLSRASQNNDTEVGRLILKNLRNAHLKGHDSCDTADMDPVWKRAILAGLFDVLLVDTLQDLPDSHPDALTFAKIDLLRPGAISSYPTPPWISNFDPYRYQLLDITKPETEHGSRGADGPNSCSRSPEKRPSEGSDIDEQEKKRQKM